ncbi:DUF4870 family protein [Pseudoduganella lutea]|uniref:Transmembrane protein n=1 Tax=Pseudoduganella lutea TaxID=321985 RepID=A0A4P6L6X3_9BURK|nr:hypothetical protein [Pseudoduganella lutea]QBE66642.1 hypothetical protein EWM63_29765 [Pseudoduganella lutea]
MVQDLVHDPRTDSAKSWAQGLYIAHGVCLLFTLGTLSFIPLIFNYVKRPEAAGTFVHTHHDWQIRSFWWYVVWVVVGWMLVFTFIGILVAWIPFLGAWLWKAYRIIRGFIALNNNEPIP